MCVSSSPLCFVFPSSKALLSAASSGARSSLLMWRAELRQRRSEHGRVASPKSKLIQIISHLNTLETSHLKRYETSILDA